MKYTAKITICMVTFVGLVPWLASCNIASSGGSLAAKPETLEKPSYTWRQTDTSLALLNHDQAVWQLNFDKQKGKPYFHPVALTDGTELTWLRPPDHPWHRGLWFSWKYINGLNYWEEDRRTGLSEGRTELVDVKVTAGKDHSARFEMTLSYHPPGKPAVLTEKRLIGVSAPDRDGRYRIDWQSSFTASEKDVLLARTPILGEKDGKSWGGYAGLSARLAENASDCQVIDSQSRRNPQANKKHSRWLGFSFKTAAGKFGGIAMFDHPVNPRHPSPWYVITDEPMRYFSPSFLYYKPYTLPAGKNLTLRYRILIHPGRTELELMEEEWKALKTLKEWSGR